MQSYLIFVILLGVATSIPIVPSNNYGDITLVKSHREYNEDGSFSWAYENSDGAKQEQSGYLKNPGTKNAGIFIQGAFSYKDKDNGDQIATKFTADENGFLVEGRHLPTPPPLPEHVVKLLAIVYANAKKQVREAQSGFY